LDVYRTVFEILPLKARKILVLPTPPWRPRSEWPLSNFVMKFGYRKLESWGYQMVKKSWLKSSLWHNTGVWQTDGQTDRRTRCCRKDALLCI